MTDQTTPPLDLPALTMIAKGATQADWMILPSQQTRGAHSIPGVARTICATSANARHIAAFDPPTVLALLDRVTAAEAAIARVTREVDHWLGGGEEDKYHADQIVMALNRTSERTP